MGLREIKDRARRDLHAAMEVPAYYFDPGSDFPIPCTVRVHNRYDGLGDVLGTSFRYAERRNDVPTLIFLRDQIDPVNKALVTISDTEGYRVNTVDPPYLQTVQAACTPMTTRERQTYPNPNRPVLAAGGALRLPALTSEVVPFSGELPALGVSAGATAFLLADADVQLPALE